MQDTATPVVSKVPISIRLLIALALGLQLGSIAFYKPPSLGWEWISALPIAVLLAAMVASIWLDPRVRRGDIDMDRVMNGLMRFLLVMVIPILLLFIVFFFMRSVETIVLALVPLILGVVTAFTVVGNRHTGLAIGAGLIAWIGAGIPFVFSTYMSSKQPGDSFGDVFFIVVTLGVVIGFAFAGLGGFLGRLLRRWVLG